MGYPETLQLSYVSDLPSQVATPGRELAWALVTEEIEGETLEDLLCEERVSRESACARTAASLPCYHKRTAKDALKIVSASVLETELGSNNNSRFSKLGSAMNGLHAMNQLNILHGDAALSNLIVPTLMAPCGLTFVPSLA